MLPSLLRPATGFLHTNAQILLLPTVNASRGMSSASAVVDQMLTYVWGDLKGQGQAAVDVLRSGLSMQADPSQGTDSARLHLALAEVFAAEHDWAQAASSSQAAAAAESAAAGLHGLATYQATRALLVSGRDQDAAAAASAASSSSSVVHTAQQLMVQHALGAKVSQLQQQLQHHLSSSGSGGSSGRVHQVLSAVGHKLCGDAALAQGQFDAAASSYGSATGLMLAGSSSSSGDDGSSHFTADVAAGLSVRIQQEIAADIALGAAQVCMFQKQWEAAEDKLSTALKSAEAAAGESSPLLAPVLLLLATGYARQARVMYAEGMLRECAKLLGGTEPHRLVEKAGSSSSSHQAVHTNLKAAVCWRYCQLLTALPNRAAAAAAWGTAAKQMWGKAGGFIGCNTQHDTKNDKSCNIEAVLGDDVALKGQGEHGHGKGVVVSLFLRRLLPVYGSSSGSTSTSEQ